uniref:Protein-S-isoprenylcysteine O-methyltransferase n=1 Tax=Tetraselmis sp. GSL018 TaxID=582737 RepID=A0A061R6S1_9CHLO
MDVPLSSSLGVTTAKSSVSFSPDRAWVLPPTCSSAGNNFIPLQRKNHTVISEIWRPLPPSSQVWRMFRRRVSVLATGHRRDTESDVAESSDMKKKLYRWWEGRGKVFSLAQAVLVPAALPSLVPFPESGENVADAAAQTLGVFLLALGVGLMVSGIRDIGENFSFFPEPKPKDIHSLTTKGVMSVLRHPQYSGTVAFCWGVALLTGAGPFRLAACLATTQALKLNAELEDSIMLERYGSAFERYREAVPSMIPKDFRELVTAIFNLNKST